MERVLFVDIDDTLILWSIKPVTGLTWEPNKVVIDFINSWHEKDPLHRCVRYWSTGGADWAQEIVMELRSRNFNLPLGPYFTKYNRIPRNFEFYIDDMPLNTYASVCVDPKALLNVELRRKLIEEGGPNVRSFI